MNRLKKAGLLAVAAAIVLIGSEIGSQMEIPGVPSAIPEAQAVVGRPLTPVSVAGVGRRTVRRCAVGVYHC
jgi:hypothetical protein